MTNTDDIESEPDSNSESSLREYIPLLKPPTILTRISTLFRKISNTEALVRFRQEALRSVVWITTFIVQFIIITILLVILKDITPIDDFGVDRLYRRNSIILGLLFTSMLYALYIISYDRSGLVYYISNRIANRAWKMTVTNPSRQADSTNQSVDQMKDEYLTVAAKTFPLGICILISVPAVVYMYTGVIDGLRISISYVGIGVLLGGFNDAFGRSLSSIRSEVDASTVASDLASDQLELLFLIVASIIQLISTFKPSASGLIGQGSSLMLLLIAFYISTRISYSYVDY
jgi:hypothetical protein